MIGMVLAAGAGRRLGALTEALPKALLRVHGDDSVLEVTLGNFASIGLTEVVVVTGFAAERIDERVPGLQERFGLRVRTIFNPRAEEWNNAYSLWCAREAFAQGVLLVNGDTLTPPVVLERVLAGRGEDILLAVDLEKPLGAEEMKVLLDGDGLLKRIHKSVDPGEAHGEHIGVTVIERAAAPALAQALQATFERDPQHYYEDAFQLLADGGARVGSVPIGAVDWVEIDDDRDLARARAITTCWP